MIGTHSSAHGLGVESSFIGLWSALPDHHGERRGVVLSEGEVGVRLGNLSLPLIVGATAATGAGWPAGLADGLRLREALACTAVLPLVTAAFALHARRARLRAA